MNNEKKLVPKLRFPEFTHAWEQRKLGEITNSYSGGTPSVSNRNYYGGNIPFIRSGEISLEKTELCITDDGLNNSSAKLVSKGDILYALYGATSGEVSRSLINGAINQAILAIQPHDNFSPEFIIQWLKGKKLHIVSSYLQGGQGNLSAEIVKNLVISIPQIQEQQKIGTFFTALDRYITIHHRKLDNVKKLKAGLLQKMFPKNDQEFPEIRFPEFTYAWEQRKLGDLCQITTGKLDANAMVDGGQYDFFTSGIKKYKIDCYAFVGPAITIAGNGATVGYMHYADGYFNAYQRTYVLTDFCADRTFLFQIINKNLPKKIQQESRSGNIPYIVMDMLTDLHITIPDSREQNMIANLYSKVDRYITIHQRK